MSARPYDIPELDLQVGRSIIRIPMEQDVPFTDRVRALVDTPEFQRLQSITQLGLAQRVYPGATHTRFEHALGVFHNTLQYIGQLGHDSRFRDAVDRHSAEVLIVSALLHDLGHWPFCHPIEDLGLADLPSHEVFAASYLSDDSELTAVLDRDWGVTPDEVLDVLAARTDTPRLRLLRSILSGPIDVDKMDYLGRDSLHAGVPYGRNFDKHRLIHSLLLNEAGDGLAISTKGKTAAELMVFARYVMFSEVYWHHAVRSATSMFARAFFDLHNDMDLAALFRKSESAVIDEMKRAARGQPCEQLLAGVFGSKRDLFKRIDEYSHYQTPELYRQLSGRPYAFLAKCGNLLSNQLAALGVTVGPCDLLIDAPPQHREVEFRVDLYFPKEAVYRPLRDVSPVIDALARTRFDDYVKRVRVFVAPRLARQLGDQAQIRSCLEQAIADAECA